MFRVSCLSSLVLASALGATPEEPESLRARSFELLDGLGSPSYRVRNEAAGQLLRMGRDALAALTVGMADPNPEVRLRCERLYPIIERIDLAARLDKFLADPSGTHDLPGAERFLAAVGDDETTRTLYAEMIRNDGRLMVMAGTGGGQLAQRYYQRVREVQDRFSSGVRVVNGERVLASLTDQEMATLLFVGSSPKLEDFNDAHQLFSGLFYNSQFQTTLKGDKPAAVALRKLLLGWLEGRTRDFSAYQGMYLVLRIDMKEALPVAKKVAAEASASSQARGMAAMAVGKFGSEDDLPTLEKMLDDEAVIANIRINNVQGTTQVRDVALAMCVHLSGQDHKDYPFEMLQGAVNFQSYYNLGFATEEKRQEAMEKWAASRKKE